MTRYTVLLASMGMLMFVACGPWTGQAAAQVNVDVGGVHVHVGDHPEAPLPAEGVEVLTRGPIHEAFAQPVVLDEATQFVITQRPPAPLEEIVPDEKPEGNNVIWIPGYWSWDSDRNDFVWVSGCWRAVPPGAEWVPGYWAQCPGGYQWVAGFWTTEDTDEIEYLPAPPATLDEGPQGAGSPDSIWIPGCWIRHDGRYAWRPGFWETARPNWVWEPAHYVCTPRGWVFVDGYWDYPLHRRGVAYLPVYCPASQYGSSCRYAPEYVLDLDGLTANLFICPQRHHYYFGDYYGAEYARDGFHPWYESGQHHDWYDPIYVHRQWSHHDDHQWAEHQRENFEHRRDDKTLRPPRTYEAMRTHVAALPQKERKDAMIARPMKDVVSDKAAPFKFETLDAKHREQTDARQKELHAYKDQRSQWESASALPKAEQGPKEGPANKEVITSKEPAHAPMEGPANKEVITSKEPAHAPKELPKEPAKEVAPAEKLQKVDHGAVPKEQAAAVQAEKVKIPRSPMAVHEQVRGKDATPPAKPKMPEFDMNAHEKHGNEAPAHPGNEGADKPGPARK